METKEIDARFRNYLLNDEDQETLNRLRKEITIVAHSLNNFLPENREKSLAITHLEEVLNWVEKSLNRKNERK